MTAGKPAERETGYRPLIAVASPIAGIQLAQVALTTTDLIMMGSLSISAIAAGGLAVTLYNQLRTMCVGVVTSVGNLVAGTVGRGEQRSGRTDLDEDTGSAVTSICRSSFLVATLVGALGALLLVGLSWALSLFGQNPAILALSRPTMWALAPGLIPMLWLNVLRQFAVGMRRPGSLLGVTIVSVALNAVLDGGFVYGWLGMPILGLPGVGLATTLVQAANFVAFLLILRRDRVLAKLLSLAAWRADIATVREILRLGIPISLTYGSEAGITSVATLFMGGFGPVALAAHNVVNQLAYIVYQFNIGISQGSSILVSRAIGLGNRDEAAHVARRALTLGAAVMTLAAIVYLSIPRWVLEIFLDRHPSPAVVAAASVLLFFGIAQQYCKGTQNIAVGLLRGLGNTRVGFHMTLIGYWAIGTPAMIGFGYGLHLGGPGVWLGLCIGFGATAVLLLYRFRSDLRALRQKTLSPS
ncbi:MAG TPA: MATE family efflux transporter [Pseudonocardia sp.]|nr:MATE family efflux transporter [Pseudonocardia sp.]